MTINNHKVQEILDILRSLYPGWDGFSHPAFVKDEIAYKQNTIAKARELLNEGEWQRLLAAGQTDELLHRLEMLGRDNNLLWISAPMKGDLNILYQPHLDKTTFCQVMFDLLHGPGPSPERLDRYLAVVTGQGLPNRWTFPTYFLFICHPDSEMFIKPTPVKQFLELVQSNIRYDSTPRADTYRDILQLVADVRAAFADFGPRDNVDIQGLIWACYQHARAEDNAMSAPTTAEQGTASQLAQPFSSIFRTWAEADWAFDLFADVAKRLGVTGPADPRVAFTYGVNQRRKVLRLNFGNWMVADVIRSDPAEDLHVRLALLANDFDQLGLDVPRYEPFAPKKDAPVVRHYELSASQLATMTTGLRGVYEASFACIADVFKHWKGSPWRFAHEQELFDAVLDPGLRHRLFAVGVTVQPVSDMTDLAVSDEQLAYAVDSVHPDAAFGPRAFELLAGIHANPTSQFYQAHKDEFRSEIEEPFARLLYAVAAQLPAAVREVMETEKRVVSRFLKNDWGRGGAWDFYWGAFYPKGGKRTEGAQLITIIHPDRFEYGFSIGDYGGVAQQRFQRNLQAYHATMTHLLDDPSGGGGFVLGDTTNYQLDAEGHVITEVPYTWQDFLRDPTLLGTRVVRIVPRQQVVQMAAGGLAAQIAQGFAQLFPLVLYAIYDDPMSAVAGYLEGPEPLDEEGPDVQSVYTLAQVAEETGFDPAALENWVQAIARKGQAILYGPPGTGKTFMAERLASHLIGGGDGFSELIQFHPAYAYEDFIQGIRPLPHNGGGLTYAVVPGRFLEFCRRAEKCRGTCVLIIDEINRANLARVFGELMYLLEYRDKKIPLSGGGQLRIPPNVRVIGTMNTADRSIALVDHALRRRFAFLPLHPQYDVLRRYQAQANPDFPVGNLISVLQQLNRTINDPHYEVGISFFLQSGLDSALSIIWTMEIEPYLEEYFFDQRDKVDEFRWDKVQKRIMP